jgi:hypothetical protein
VASKADIGLLVGMTDYDDAQMLIVDQVKGGIEA